MRPGGKNKVREFEDERSELSSICRKSAVILTEFGKARVDAFWVGIRWKRDNGPPGRSLPPRRGALTTVGLSARREPLSRALYGVATVSSFLLSLVFSVLSSFYSSFSPQLRHIV